MIHIKDVMPVPFLKKEPFSGSYQGMRYRMEKTEIPLSDTSGDTKTMLKVYIWPQPLCFDKTSKESIIQNVFDFSPEGLALAVDWLNQVWQSGRHHEHEFRI